MKKVFAVPHTHYDAVWIFTEEEYYHINLEIIKKACELLEKYPEFTFLFEQTHFLEKLKSREPELFEKVKKFVKEGRIEIASGEYLMPDLLLPQEEVIVRELLRGKLWIEKELGVSPRVMWQADSFGLPAQLPQICKKAGYDYIAFRRGCPFLKPSEFIWKALDGSEVIAHSMPLGYRAGLHAEKWEENIKFLSECSATKNLLMPCGSGVTIPNEKWIEKAKNWKKEEKIIFSTPSRFFSELEKERKKFIVYEGEMLERETFPDTASSRIELKLLTRKLERITFALEELCTVFSLNNEKNVLKESWEVILFTAFHDVITGTLTDENFERIFEKIKRVLEEGVRAIQKLIEKITKNEESNTPCIAVFNPLPWSIEEWIEAEVILGKEQYSDSLCIICENEKYPAEIIEKREENEKVFLKIGFVASLPPCGIAAFRVVSENVSAKRAHEIEIEFGEKKGYVNIFLGKNLVCKAGEIVVEDEKGDLYAHSSDIGVIKSESGEGIKYPFFKMLRKERKETKLRKILEEETELYLIRWPYRVELDSNPKILKEKAMRIKKKAVLYKTVPRVDFFVEIDNKFPECRIRTRTVFGEKPTKIICDTQFGRIERRPGKYPCLRWCNVYAKNNIAIANTGTCEYEIYNNKFFITFLRSVPFLSKGDAGPRVYTPLALELGEHSFVYSVYFPESEEDAHIHAWQINYKPFVITFYGNPRFEKTGFLEISPKNIILTAMKNAEDGNGVVIRIYESCGKKSRVKLRLWEKVRRASLCNLLEKEVKDERKIEINENEIVFEINPFEIVTLRIFLEKLCF